MNAKEKGFRNFFLVLASCIVIYWLLNATERVQTIYRTVKSIAAPFLIGAAIAFVLNVLMKRIERHLGWIRKPGIRRACAMVMTLVCILLVIALVVNLVIPQVNKTARSLLEKLPDFFGRVQTSVIEFLNEYPQFKEWLSNNTELENLDVPNLIQKLGGFAANSMATIINGTVNAIGSVTGAVVNAVISFVFAIYALSQKENLARQGKKIIYSYLPERICDEMVRILRLANTTFSNFISGQCLEAVILGCMFAVSMLIFRMPYVPLVSVMIAVTALVPIVGAFVGCVLGAFFILVESPVQAVTFVIMFLILQQIEGNLIYPKVVGTSVGLPGIWVLVAATVGGDLMGIAGMLLMIPLASVLYVLLREATDRRLDARQIDAAKIAVPVQERRISPGPISRAIACIKKKLKI